MGHTHCTQLPSPLMKRPALYWNEHSLKTYASQHVQPDRTADVLANAHDIIFHYPLKYFILSHIVFFLMEYFVPIYFRCFSRFSTLSPEKARFILNYLHHHASMMVKLTFNLYKIPVLLSIKSSDMRTHEI